MVKAVSVTSFMLDDRLVDTVALQYQARKLGGAKLHRIAQGIGILRVLAADLYDGYEIDVEQARRSFKSVNEQLVGG